MQFHRPETLEAALHLLSEEPVRLLAGGTDFFPALAGKTTAEPVVDLCRIKSLNGISRSDGAWRFGATTSWSDIRDADLPAQFLALQQAAREVGSIQIQNAGTIAGNLCNASPAADGVPPLLALDADVEIAGPAGVRRVPLERFITGVRRTVLQPGEIVTAVLVPEKTGCHSAFLKLGARRYLVISIAMVAVALDCADDGKISEISVAVGSCSQVARRLPSVEAALAGTPAEPTEVKACLKDVDLAPLAPIDDVRAPADYRLIAVRELIGRAVLMAAQEGR